MKAKYLVSGGLALAMAVPLSASAVLFNFNGISLTTTTSQDGLDNAATSSAIAAWMNTVTGCSPNCVSSVTGALATANYTADGNGYKFPSGTLKGQYMTLGTTDGATGFTNLAAADTYSPDIFIMNNNFGLWGITSDSFTINFTNPLAAGTVVSFDWEIFADGSAEQPPDMTFAGGGINYTWYGSAPPGGGADQGIGTKSYTLTSATTSLTWSDWPPEVGIDDLSIVPPPLKTVPEPSPLTLTGLALALLALVRWKVRRGPALIG